MQAPPAYAGHSPSTGPTGYVQPGQSQQASNGFIMINQEYIRRGSGGILKMAEIGLCLIVIICNNVFDWTSYGGGWVNFVVIISIFGSAFLYFVHVYDLPSRMIAGASFRYGELVFYGFLSICWLIAGIVAAARAGELVKAGPSVAACAVFSFVALVIYCCATYFASVAWRQRGHSTEANAPYNSFPDTRENTMNVSGTGTAGSGGAAAAGNPYSYSQPGFSVGPGAGTGVGTGTTTTYSMGTPGYQEKSVY